MKVTIILPITVILVIAISYTHNHESFGMVGKVELNYGLSVTNVSVIPSNLTDGPGYTFLGIVDNPTQRAFDFVTVYGEFYNASGNLEGLQTAHIIKKNLLPTEKSAFKLEFVPIKGTNIDHYVLSLDEDAGQETRDITPLGGSLGNSSGGGGGGTSPSGGGGGGGGGGNVTVNFYLNSQNLTNCDIH